MKLNKLQLKKLIISLSDGHCGCSSQAQKKAYLQHCLIRLLFIAVSIKESSLLVCVDVRFSK
jgi:hypothetical protein